MATMDLSTRQEVVPGMQPVLLPRALKSLGWAHSKEYFNAGALHWQGGWLGTNEDVVKWVARILMSDLKSQ